MNASQDNMNQSKRAIVEGDKLSELKPRVPTRTIVSSSRRHSWVIVHYVAPSEVKEGRQLNRVKT